MTCNEAYNIALKIVDAAMRNLQFFIAICTAVVGWILASETIVDLDRFASKRFLIAVVFTIPTLGLLIGEIEILKRVNAALDVSRDLFEKENNGLSEATIRLHAQLRTKISAFAMGGTIFAVDAMILLYKGVTNLEFPYRLIDGLSRLGDHHLPCFAALI